MPADDPATEGPWTVLKALHWTTDYFRRHNLEGPRIDAEVLLAHTLHCERIDLYLRYDKPLNQDELTRFRHLIKRRLQREPVAYIVGAREFWSLRLEVAPAVLIPRPETECLVEEALKILPQGACCQVLELGIGSGAVIVALAHERPECRFWASDRSGQAVATARKNAATHVTDNRVRFLIGHWLDPIAPRGSFDLILSNPPYIPSDDIRRLPLDIRRFEPVAALDGGPDGLRDIGEIIAQAHYRLKPGGALLLEIGFDQRVGVEALAGGCDAYETPRFRKDYAGHDRVAHLRKKD